MLEVNVNDFDDDDDKCKVMSDNISYYPSGQVTKESKSHLFLIFLNNHKLKYIKSTLIPFDL